MTEQEIQVQDECKVERLSARLTTTRKDLKSVKEALAKMEERLTLDERDYENRWVTRHTIATCQAARMDILEARLKAIEIYYNQPPQCFYGACPVDGRVRRLEDSEKRQAEGVPVQASRIGCLEGRLMALEFAHAAPAYDGVPVQAVGRS